MKERKYQRRYLTITIACVAGIVLACLIRERRRWIWLPWNPAYSIHELKGMNVNEVISHLGQPSYDPVRYQADGLWDEEEDGPYYLGYFGFQGATCTIVFKRGVVVEVRLGSK